MLGFFPLADIPLASGQWSSSVAAASQTVSLTLNSVTLSTDQTVPLSSQTLVLTENSVSLSAGVTLPLDSQNISLALNSVSLSVGATLALTSQNLTLAENDVTVEVQPPTFDSQTLTLTLNDAVATATANAELSSQTLTFTENSVDIATDHTIQVNGEIPILSTLNNVGLSLDAVLTPTSQQINFTLNSVSLITDQILVAPSQTIYTTLNSLREWIPINTWQPGSCTDGIDGQWFDIPFDTEVYGDDFAIAAEPLCALPQPLPPIRKFPGTPWTNVPATTTTTWSNIQT